MSVDEDARDALLVDRVRRGDADAYGELARRHLRRAFAIAWRILEHREDAEDVVQDAFLRALERLDTLKRGQAFRPWFQRIVVNQALNVRRSRKVRRTEPITETAPAPTRSPEAAAVDAETRERIRSAMARLPERQRVIVLLSELEGYTSKEIAEILEVPPGTVRWHLHQARAALREALSALEEDVK